MHIFIYSYFIQINLIKRNPSHTLSGGVRINEATLLLLAVAVDGGCYGALYTIFILAVTCGGDVSHVTELVQPPFYQF